MRPFDSEDKKFVKEVQQILLRNTADLNDDIRARIYTAFNNVNYKYLTSQEADERKLLNSIAFFSTQDRTIYVVNGRFLNLRHALLHEMIHSVTSPDKFHSGFANIFVKFSESGNSQIMTSNAAINEAATEFYATIFTGDYGKCGYQHYVHIYNYLSEVCGYNNLKNAYFACDLNAFKNIVATSFNLDNTALVDKLISQLETLHFYGANKTDNKALMLLSECYFTLVQMTFCKLKHENPNLPNNIIANMIDVNNITKPMQNSEEFIKRILNVMRVQLYDQLLCLDDLTPAQYRSNRVNENAMLKFVDNMDNPEFFKRHKQYIAKYLPDLLMQFFKRQTLYDGQNYSIKLSDVYTKIVSTLFDDNGKLDLSQLSQIDRRRAMTIMLLGPFAESCKLYDHLKPKDVVEYVNNNRNAWTGFKNHEAIEKCIFPVINQLSQTVKSNKNFYNYYQEVYSELTLKKIFGDRDINL